MKRTSLIILIISVCMCMICVGCSKSSSQSEWNSSFDSYIGGMNNSASFDEAAPEAPIDSIGSEKNAQVPDFFTQRKVIRNAKLTVETLEFDNFISNVTAKTNELQGYIQTNSVNSRGYYRGYNLRSAEMILRIPADKLDEFLTAVDGIGNIIERYEDVNDVTDTYVDIEARLSSLRTEYDTLLELLGKADSLESIITLQDRLSDVRYEIESYEAKIRSYDSLIAYSTVRINVNEVERETAVEQETFGQEVSRRFNESLQDIGEGFTRFAAWFIGNLPVILTVLIIFIGIPVLIAVIIIKASRKRKKKAAAKAAEKSED